MAGKPLPHGKWTNATSSALVMTGGLSEPFFHVAATVLTDRLERAKHQMLPGQGHDAASDALAPILIEFFNH